MYTAKLGRHHIISIPGADLQPVVKTEQVRLADERRTKIALTISCSNSAERI